MSDNSLEQQIRDLMGGLEFKPDAAVWDKVRAEIAPEKKRRVIAWWFPVLLLLLLGGGIVALFNRSGKPALNGQQAVTTVKATAPAADNTTIIPEPATTGGADAAVTGKPTNENNTTVTAVTGAGITASSGTNQVIVPKTRPVVQTTTHTIANIKPSDRPTLQGNSATTNNAILVNVVTDERSADPVQQFLLLPDPAIVQQDQLLISQEPLTAIADPKNPFQPALAMPSPPVIKRKDAGKWQTLFFVNTGVNAVKAADNMSVADEQKRQIIEQQNKSQSFAIGSPGTTIGNPFATSNTLVYTKSRVSSGAAFGAGVLAGKRLSDRWEIETGLRYQYAAYTITTSYLTDSFARSSVTGQFANIPTVNATEVYHYQLHYLGIPVLLHYKLGKPLGITAGLMNDFVVIARQNSQSVRSEMPVWNPAAYFSFAIKIPGGDKYQWQVMPYLQYGLSAVFKNFSEQRLLQPGVQVLLRLNK